MERANTFSWRSVLIGGACGIGLAAFGGTLVANVGLQLALARGLSFREAYAAMWSNDLSFSLVVACVVQFVAAGIGGYVGASLAGDRPLLHGLCAGLFGFLFGVVMYFGPSSGPVSVTLMAWNLLAPVVAGVAGGGVYARRT
jgi:hypothetical protein